MAIIERKHIFILMFALLFITGIAVEAAVLVSGSDTKVRAATIAADSAAKNIVIFWESTQFATNNEHLRFNRSTNGGKRWKQQPLEFDYNTINPWFSDYLPEITFDSKGVLHILWSLRNDQVSPCYTQTANLGDTWANRSHIGTSNLPRFEGLALCVGENPADLWAVYSDFNWHTYVCTSSDSSKTWASTDISMGGDPDTGYCSSAASDGEMRYIFRIRDKKPEIITYDGAKYSSIVPQSSDSISIAENHTIAVDSKGRIFAVYADAGEVVCLRSDDKGKSFSHRAVVTSGADIRLPVLTVTGKDNIAVAWEQAGKVLYSVSGDAASAFSAPKAVAPASVAQSAPDICSVGESLFFSYTQGGGAWFTGIPSVPNASSAKLSTKNLFPNAGFEKFNGAAPAGWKVDSWNQEFLKERFGKGKPGRGGKGFCLEMKEGNGASVIDFTGPSIAVDSDVSYVVKGYYASTCDRIEVNGTWLDKNGNQVSSFSLVLPDTQNRWIEFFDEVNAPVGCVALKFGIRKKWQTGRVRFDDFSLRAGTLQNYAMEFSLPPVKPGEFRYPIFGWCVPGGWIDSNTYPLKLYNSEKAFAEYAMANFTLGSYAKYGTKRQGSAWSSDDVLIKENKDPSVHWIHGGDEPGMSAFPDLAKVSERVRKLAPNKPYMVNLLPTYGFASYKDYEEYLDGYIKAVKPVIYTYDHYALTGPNNSYNRDFFANFELFRKHALKNNMDWGVILLVTSHGGQRSPSDAELRWQAFNSLAYGSRTLGWFTYLTEVEYGGWNWRDAAINWDGTRSRHYSMLKYLNAEVLKIGNIILRLKSTGVYHTKPLPELTRDIAESELIKKISSGQWTVGEFAGSGKSRYVMLVNREYSRSQTASVVFKGNPKAISQFDSKTGKWIKSSAYDKKTSTIKITVDKGEQRFYRLEK